MKLKLFLALVAFRVLNALFIKTFFQPDEYWQSLEPAHIAVYGYGYKTWEWREHLRSATHPLIFAGVYKLAEALHIDVVLAPKLFQGVMAAVGDYYQFVLARRLLSSEGAVIALLTSVFSAFNWFFITRTFANSLEMVLTTAALAYWPWNSKNVSYSRLVISLAIAAFSCVIRPTNVLIWAFLGGKLVLRLGTTLQSLKVVGIAAVTAFASLTANFYVDQWYYGEPVFPFINFIKFNIFQSLSQFYGTSPPHFYFSQGLPMLLMAFLPHTIYEMWKSRSATITQAIFFVIMPYSFLKHKEWRFIYPLLPLLHILFSKSIMRIEVRPMRYVTLVALMLIHAPVAIYFTRYHQRGVVDVVDYMRHDPKVLSAGFLMPCHSTPWQSHLHRNIPAWFLTCEPPLHQSANATTNYLDIADMFYADPISFLDKHFPSTYGWPSHLSFFEQLEPTVQHYLETQGYEPHKRFFNSHFHDDWRRRGDVVVYKKT